MFEVFNKLKGGFGMKKILKWENKFSKETGYVKTVSVAKGYFVNTYDKEEAKAYRCDKAIQKDLEILEGFGEFENNTFTVEEI